jgi:hypothetical protein
MKHYFLIFSETIVGRNMKYNEAKLIIQSESYLTGADNSIIRRKGDFVETLKDRNVHNQFQKGDIAYEAMGLFTREKVDRYCMVQQNKGSVAMVKKIDKDTKQICHLYWYFH